MRRFHEAQIHCVFACSCDFFWINGQRARATEIDASVNYSYLRANPGTSGFNGFNLNGGSASAAYNFKDWVSGVADFGGYHVGSYSGVNVDDHMLTYLFGPRFTYRGHRRISPFGQVLFGGARAGSGVFATSNPTRHSPRQFGAGVDWNVRDRSRSGLCNSTTC